MARKMKGILKGESTCSIYLSDRRPTIIGRSDRREALIQWDASGKYFNLQDLFSGVVFVNNFQILRGSFVQLKDGDVIRLGMRSGEGSAEYQLQVVPSRNPQKQKTGSACTIPWRPSGGLVVESSTLDLDSVSESYSPSSDGGTQCAPVQCMCTRCQSVRRNSAETMRSRQQEMAVGGGRLNRSEPQTRRDVTRNTVQSCERPDKHLQMEIDSLRKEVDGMQTDKCLSSGVIIQMQKDIFDRDLKICSLMRDVKELKGLCEEERGLRSSLGFSTSRPDSMSAAAHRPIHSDKEDARREYARDEGDDASCNTHQRNTYQEQERRDYSRDERVVVSGNTHQRNANKNDDGREYARDERADASGNTHQRTANKPDDRREYASDGRADVSGKKTHQGNAKKDVDKRGTTLDDRADDSGNAVQRSKNVYLSDLRKITQCFLLSIMFLISSDGKQRWRHGLDDLGTKEVDERISALEIREEMSALSLQKTTNLLSKLRGKLAIILGLSNDFSEDLIDDQLLEKISKAMEELKETKQNYTQASSSDKQLLEMSKKVREDFTAAQIRSESIKSNPAALLQKQADIIRTGLQHQHLADIKFVMLSMNQAHLNWLKELQDAFEQAGVETQSTATPTEMVQELSKQIEEYRKQCGSLRMLNNKTVVEHKRELESAIECSRREFAGQEMEKLQNACSEHEANQKVAVDRAVIAERKRSEAALTAAQSKLAEMELLQTAMDEELQAKEDEIEFYKEQECVHQREVDGYRRVEAELREQIIAKQSSMSENVACVEECLRKKYEHEMEQFQRLIQCQEATIAAHQQRLNKALMSVRKNSRSNNDEDAKQNAKTSHTIDKLKAELEKHRIEAKKLCTELTWCRTSLSDKDIKLAELSKELTDVQRKLADSSVELSQSQAASGLAEKGAKCIGECHDQIIERQREVITELKTSVSDVTKNRKTSTDNAGKICSETAPNKDIVKQRNDIKDFPDTDTSSGRGVGGRRQFDGPENNTKQRNSERDRAGMDKFPPPRSSKVVPSPPMDGNSGNSKEPKAENAPNSRNPRNSVDSNSKNPRNSVDSRSIKNEGSSSMLNPKNSLAISISLSDADLSSETEISNTKMRVEEILEDKVRDMLQLLQLSEESYETLVKTVVSILQLDVGLIGFRLLTDLVASNARENLVRQRADARRQIGDALEQLTTNADRQTQLIGHLEQRLVYLRDAETIAEEKSRQVESLTADLCSRVEETVCLREMIRRLQEVVDTPRPVYSKMKAKKVCFQSSCRRSPSPRHRCSR